MLGAAMKERVGGMRVKISGRWLIACALVLAGCAGERYPPGTMVDPAPPVDPRCTSGDPLAKVANAPQFELVRRCQGVTGAVQAVQEAPSGEVSLTLKPDDVSLRNRDTGLLLAVLDPADHLYVTPPTAGDHVEIMGAFVRNKQTGLMEVRPVWVFATLHPPTVPTDAVEHRSRTSAPPAPLAAPATAASADGPRDVPKRLVIQRKTTRFPTAASLAPSGMLQDLGDLRWVAMRGGAGIEGPVEEKAAKDVVVIVESDRPESALAATYVRLYYAPYRPEPGVNDHPHQDLIFFVDPGDEANAYLGVQNPDQPDRWQMTLLPGYGPWLKKELDLFLRLRMGM